MAADPFASVKAQSERTGGFVCDMTHHAAAYLPASGRRLAVTFDNLAARRDTESRTPWAQAFLAPKDWDILGVMSKRYDWFRHPDVWDLFDRLQAEGFFRRFAQVAFYGASMGGYGALAFGRAAPGCTVLAFAPQTTLDPAIAPFESRYRYGRSLGDWSGRYADAAEVTAVAGKVYVGFDPLEPLDSRHAARLSGPNVVHLPMPGTGHKLPPALLKMGLLKPLVDAALDADLDRPGFHAMFRARRTSLPWVLGLLTRAGRNGHHRLAREVAERIMTDWPHWKLRHLVNDLRGIEARRGVSSGSDPT